MKYLPIIIARMGSSRLPGKVLLDLCGKPVLERIVERVKRVPIIEEVVIATTKKKADDKIFKWCIEKEISCFRSSEEDVILRVIGASKWIDAMISAHDYIIDITADCPLVCPEMIKSMISRCEILKPDYASNIAVRSFCDGFDIQIVKKEVLYNIYHWIEDYHKCHSTWNVLAYASNLKIYNMIPKKQEYWMPEVGLTLDTPMDYEVIKRIYEHFADKNYVFNHHDIYALIQEQPEILDINKNVKRKVPGRDES